MCWVKSIPVLSLSEGQVQSQSICIATLPAQSQGKYIQNQHFGPGEMLCGILNDKICSLTLELLFLPQRIYLNSLIICRTRNIL